MDRRDYSLLAALKTLLAAPEAIKPEGDNPSTAALRLNRRAQAELPFAVAYFVYIMTNKPRGTLYVGVTNDIARRAWEHREGVAEGFTRSYGVKRLAHVETYEQIVAALQRERRLKHWNRAWKIALIEKDNPDWDDLYSVLV